MTTSQKFTGYCIVPWASSAEWLQVYINIFGKESTVETKQDALNRIQMWQRRIPLLPSGIEGTLCIVEAMVADPKDFLERQYSCLCATNIMRFLNICVASRAQVNNFTKTVKSNSIPDWIINIRHDLAHNQKLPSPAILKLALQECFKWLKDNYWDPEIPLIKDNIISATSESQYSDDIPLLLKIYSNLIFNCKNGLEVDHVVLNELSEAGLDVTQSLETLMKSIMNILQSKKDKANGIDWESLIRELVDSKFLFISPNKLFDDNKKIYKFIESLLVYLYNTDGLIYLLREMSYILHDKMEPDWNKLSVSLWFNEIFSGLAVLKNGRSTSGIRFGTTKPEIIDHVLNLQMVLFQNLNQITKYCFKSFMALSDVTCSKDIDSYIKSNEHVVMNQFKYKVYDTIDTDQDLCHQIKTVDTDKLSAMLFCRDHVQTFTNIANLDCEVVCVEEFVVGSKWLILEDNVEYETCAIGVLPS